MGIYSDYVDSYSDLGQAYVDSGTPNYDAYVDNSSDLAAAYVNSGTPDYASYVESYSDLENFWQKNVKPTGVSRKDWGASHWSSNGSSEGRTLPRTYSKTKAEWGAEHWSAYGQREGRELPKTYSQTKDEWGSTHWNNSGRYEARVLPGPVFGLSGGQLYVNSSTVGSGLTSTLEAIKDNFNQGAYPFTTLMSSVNSSISSTEVKNLLGDTGNLDTLADYYKSTKVPLWDAFSEGLQPLVGGFDSSYYANTESGRQARNNWNSAINAVYVGGRYFDNYDITARYGDDLNTYYHQHYTSVGGPVNKERGNEVSPGAREAWMAATGAGGFVERLTDAEKQAYRDQLLGITGEAGAEKIDLAAPKYDAEGKLINTEEVNTLLERKFAEVLTGKDLQKEKQLGALAQDVLKTSINELKTAKAKESNLALMKNLPGYSEILDINTSLTNSILGDTGVGGLLSMMGARGDYKSDVQKSIEKITGVTSNSTIYNWQKWFEDTLTKRYENYEYDIAEYSDADLKEYQARAKEEIDYYNEQVAAGATDVTKPLYLDVAERYGKNGNKLDVNNIDDFKKIMFNIELESQKQFVSSFINKYLKPRFDQSKSMDEFISYLNVKEDEQNVFQSQTVINKLKQIGNLRAKGFIDLVNQSEKAMQNFNAEFYFDPLAKNTKEINSTKQKQYALQKEIVAKDFENAKNGTVGADGINWAVEAYRYGLEKDFTTNPESFAKLHYQAKGRFQQTDADGKAFNLDPAEDILPEQELIKKIKKFGSEMALRKQLYGDAGFMQFVTPEEYADYLLEAVDPTKNKEEWQKILTQLGLDYTENIQQVKDYIIEAFRTEEAKQIRENIKYLNEAQEDLTQASLGVSYIEREEDKKKIDKGQTALYNIFKNAGYGGTEDEFYSDFMPDVDRSDQQLIAQSMTDKGLTFDVGEMDDPFTAFTNISGLFGDDASVFEKDEDEEPKETSYFNIFGGDTEELPKNSKAAQSFLGEFTSMFSGFK